MRAADLERGRSFPLLRIPNLSSVVMFLTFTWRRPKANAYHDQGAEATAEETTPKREENKRKTRNQLRQEVKFLQLPPLRNADRLVTQPVHHLGFVSMGLR